MTEPKPPVGELPDLVYVSTLIATNKVGIQMCALKPTGSCTAKYVRTDKSVVIPADDFGRILECLWKIHDHPFKAIGSGALDEAIALARKYGSAE